MSAQSAAAPQHAFSHKRGQLLIDGSWVGAKNGKTFDVIETRSVTVNL